MAMTMAYPGRAITLTTTKISKATSRQTMSTIWKGTSINFSFNVHLSHNKRIKRVLTVNLFQQKSTKVKKHCWLTTIKNLIV